MIDFAPQQKAALDLIKQWHRHNQNQPFILNGYAGTGKTTIAKALPQILGVPQEGVIYAAYTGKAALQLRKKECKDATTLHRLLYSPIEKSRELLKRLSDEYQNLLSECPHAQLTKSVHDELIAERRRVSKPSWSLNPDMARLKKAKVIVVDESSMVDAKIHGDLLELNVPIIYCGDPFQLPPVESKSPVSVMPPHITLTDVHRQALGNPILNMATKIRSGYNAILSPMVEGNSNGESLEIRRLRNTSYEFYQGHDQILCGKNATRADLNRRMQAQRISRNEVVKGKEPIGEGDKIVFLRNDYESNFFNGSIGTITGLFDHEDDMLSICGETDEGSFDAYEVWAGEIVGKDKSETPRFVQSINLAYALTVHKAQGSEWDSVLLQYEPFGSDEQKARWLYTALTRSRKRCSIVIPRG